jgi:hypothetical protein
MPNVMRRTAQVVATGIAVLLTVSGCGSSPGGSASTQSAAPESSQAPASPSVTLPPRPREIRLDGTNPCELISPAQRAQFNISRAPSPGTSSTFHGANCDFNITGAGWRLTTVTSEGIDAWTSGIRQGQVQQGPAIAGFPTVTITLPSDPNRCDIAVDVANGQYLLATDTVSPSFKDRFPAPCEGARQFAAAAMSTLAQRG